MSDVADSTLETNVLPDLPEDEPITPAAPPSREEPAAAPEPPAAATRDDIRSALSELAGTIRPPAPSAPAPTQEEIAEYWAIYNPEAKNKEFFKQFFRLGDDATPEQIAQAKELFADMHGGLMRQAVKAMKNYLAQARTEIDDSYGPLREFVDEQKREKIRGRFYGDYPGLEDSRFKKIIDATARSLDNQTFNSESDYFKALAEGAAGSIKEILPDFDLGAKPKTTTPGRTPRLPRTSAGSGGGAGKGATHDALAATGSQNDIDSLEPDAE